jgi:hypothetical protein
MLGMVRALIHSAVELKLETPEKYRACKSGLDLGGLAAP